ncbi:MAG: retron St85 family effector protein [Cephaloticoccus sp.]|nr:retron St85 family effector protein [Cephaloticoccus sp.]
MHSNVHTKILDVARELRDFFVYQETQETEFAIFLCGGATTNKSMIRHEVRARIEAKRSKYTYRVQYPEDLFIEIMLGHQRESLLELENLLADSVSAVAIITESPGTLVELGAFSNHNSLCRKLIVILDDKYRTDRSFVNMGPVRRLKKSPPSKVIYESLKASSAQRIADQICEGARAIAAELPVSRELNNPITAARFYLALIYIFDPISLQDVLRIAEALSEGDIAISNVAQMVITKQIGDGLVTNSPKGLSTTRAAKTYLIDQNHTKRKASEVSGFLMKVRTQAINAVCRRRLL